MIRGEYAQDGCRMVNNKKPNEKQRKEEVAIHNNGYVQRTNVATEHKTRHNPTHLMPVSNPCHTEHMQTMTSSPKHQDNTFHIKLV